MKEKFRLIFESLFKFAFAVFIFIMILKNDFSVKLLTYPIIIVLMNNVVRNIIYLKKGVVDELFFKKISIIGIALFVFQLLGYITYSFIVTKIYIFLIVILPFWLFSIVYFKKKLFDDYDAIKESLQDVHSMISVFLIFLIIVTILGLVFMYFGFNSSTFKLYNNFTMTIGHFKEYEAFAGNDGTSYRLIYSYEVDGIEYLVETGYFTSKLPDKGSIRNVKYNPLNPSQSVIIGGNTGDFLLLLGFIFFIVPLAMLSSFIPESIKKIVNLETFIMGIAFIGIGFLALYLTSGTFSIIELSKNYSTNYLSIYILLLMFIIIGTLTIVKSFTNNK